MSRSFVNSEPVMAGSLKRAEPDLDEAVVLIRAMHDYNFPNCVTADLPLFNAIVSHMFPTVMMVHQRLEEN